VSEGGEEKEKEVINVAAPWKRRIIIIAHFTKLL
jgi:hypothetical protein